MWRVVINKKVYFFIKALILNTQEWKGGSPNFNAIEITSIAGSTKIPTRLLKRNTLWIERYLNLFSFKKIENNHERTSTANNPIIKLLTPLNRKRKNK